MDFGTILRRSWEITKKYRFLWLLGLLALITEAGGGIPTLYDLGAPLTTMAPSASPTATPAPPLVPPEPTAATDLPAITSPYSATPTSTPIVDLSIYSEPATVNENSATGTATIALAATFVFLLAIAIVIYYISYSSKAGLIIAANELEDKGSAPQLSFGKLFRDGKKFGWRLFWFNIMVGLLTLAFVVILLTPAMMVIITSQQAMAIVVTVGMFIIVLMLFLVYSVVLTVIKRLSERIIVLDGKPAFESLKLALKIPGKALGNTILTYLISITIDIVLGVAASVVFFLLGAILFGLGLIIYMLAQNTGAVLYGVIAGIGLIALFFAILGIYTTFVSTYWTLSFKKLSKM